MLLFGKNCGVGNNIEMNIAQVRTMVGTKNKFQQKSIDLLSGERSGRGKMLSLGGENRENAIARGENNITEISIDSDNTICYISEYPTA